MIGAHLLQVYHAHPFGDFRATFLGLLAAYNYEASILQVISQPCFRLPRKAHL